MLLRPQEIENVLKLDHFERYKYAMKRIAGAEMIYTLDNEENYAVSEVEGHFIRPFWPMPDYAEMMKKDSWDDFSVKKISLTEFINETLVFIQDRNYLIGIFPVNDKTGFIVTPEEFLRDINAELSWYE